ncbi:major facilitator superfamily domain-containing protein [Microdochium trichocladiopsis]|uniref:Major facilitator superfamily domain-containing protein n=1 Tax=Microdochium trichocladiopsis TaxID=1682393 RepID=A0A9P9BMK7_9PEZI|nr:major facilitator superfamily domain-containing protein [Microdochium trichocladiopsis]KAH7026368.1 major facilitator superfamily domain-containing protein [Microdochium trichocladiopsis]
MPSEKQIGHGVAAADDAHPKDIQMVNMKIQDEAGELAAQALMMGELDQESARKVRRKIDMRILPFLCITYALQFIDKTSLGYSSVYGIIPDNGLVGQQYSWASSIFYFGRFPVAKFLGVNIILWGAVLLTTAACSSFAGLASVRFILGMTEATISPGFVAVTGIWWTRQEQAGRSALWISFLGVGSFVGTLLAYGIGHIRGGLSTWKYIFLILGAMTVVWGVIFTLFVPDSPAHVSWLNENEKVVAIQRVVENKTGTKSRRFVKAQVVEAVTDPKIIVLGLISFVNAIASGGLAFGSLIIAGFGFDPLTTTLMNLPLSSVQVVSQLFCGFLASKVTNSRLHVATAAMIPPIIGTCLINQLDPSNKWGRLAGVWLLGSYPVGFMVILGLLSTNIAGSTKRSVASGWVFVCYCIGQIAGPQFFKSTEAPSYHGGIVAMLCGFILNLVLNQVLRILYVLENRKLDAFLQSKTEEELVELRKLSEQQGFEDITDHENVSLYLVSQLGTLLTRRKGYVPLCSVDINTEAFVMWYGGKLHECHPAIKPASYQTR